MSLVNFSLVSSFKTQNHLVFNSLEKVKFWEIAWLEFFGVSAKIINFLEKTSTHDEQLYKAEHTEVICFLEKLKEK